MLRSHKISYLLARLRERNIDYRQTDGHVAPAEAAMHDQAAVVPALVISPQSEWGVMEILTLFKLLDIYGCAEISVKSGGHGYFNGATCKGIMLNLSRMNKHSIRENVLYIQPGGILGHLIHILAKHRKAVPHGDCFGVGIGGHFLTAGWDPLLARKYGLGCQSVIGGRLVLWDGQVVNVDEKSHPLLLHAMRGGAAAGAGVVTELQLQLIPEPPRATWCHASLTNGQLSVCKIQKIFSKAWYLPTDISISFRFYFDACQLEPICSFNIYSLLTAVETISHLRTYLGEEITSFVTEKTNWTEEAVINSRLIPASKFLSANPGMLAEISPVALHENPLLFWNKQVTLREMGSSFFTSGSHWVDLDCGGMLVDLYEHFKSAQGHPCRDRLYTLVILGGGRMLELQQNCSMRLGKVLARFEGHWDDSHKNEPWIRDFADRLSQIILKNEDKQSQTPYRGDIWKPEQAKDDDLDVILRAYDQRSSESGQNSLSS